MTLWAQYALDDASLLIRFSEAATDTNWWTWENDEEIMEHCGEYKKEKKNGFKFSPRLLNDICSGHFKIAEVLYAKKKKSSRATQNTDCSIGEKWLVDHAGGFVYYSCIYTFIKRTDT